jgi:hypothetical protein
MPDIKKGNQKLSRTGKPPKPNFPIGKSRKPYFLQRTAVLNRILSASLFREFPINKESGMIGNFKIIPILLKGLFVRSD